MELRPVTVKKFDSLADSLQFPNTTYPGRESPALAGVDLFNATSPPFYPSPWMDGSGEWAEAYRRAQQFVSQLTLMEKVNLTTGVG